MGWCFQSKVIANKLKDIYLLQFLGIKDGLTDSIKIFKVEGGSDGAGADGVGTLTY